LRSGKVRMILMRRQSCAPFKTSDSTEAFFPNESGKLPD
jgi:hypothetical protein